MKLKLLAKKSAQEAISLDGDVISNPDCHLSRMLGDMSSADLLEKKYTINEAH